MPSAQTSSWAWLLGGLVTGTLALARLSVLQHREWIDRFLRQVDQSSERQEASLTAMASAVHELNSTLRRMGEQLGVRFEGRGPE